MSEASGPPADPAFDQIADLVRRRAGLTFSPARRRDAEQGTRRAMAKARFESAAEYLAALQSGRIGFDELVTELTVRETYFFRDHAQLAFVRRRILPDLARSRGTDHVYRIWSAGCATGEEAYTVAIILEEEGLAERSLVIGTDICKAALSMAREGRYRSWSLRGTDEASARSYFRTAREEWVLAEPLRRRVTFQHHNLVLDPYPSLDAGIWGNDLILCRNVLIYFDAAAIATVAARLFASLASGGWLVTGPSDPPLGAAAPFETVVTGEGAFYRRPATAAATTGPLHAWPDDERGDEGPALSGGFPDPGTGVAGATMDTPPGSEPDTGTDADATLCARRVRAEANLHGHAEALRSCAAHLVRYPLSIELRYLKAVLLSELRRYNEAVAAARQVIYLDRSCAVAHFTLGSLLRRCGDLAGAARAFRNAHNLSAARPRDELLPLGDQARAGRLAEAAAAQLRMLAPREEAR